MKPSETEKVDLYRDDIPASYAAKMRASGMVAWDIETSGLDWRIDRIGTCQVYSPNLPVAIVKIRDKIPARLGSVLEDHAVRKVFHHAMFDLRFMTHYWGTAPRNIACTKIASKLLDPDGKNDHSLKS